MSAGHRPIRRRLRRCLPAEDGVRDEPGAADDTGARIAVRSLDGMKRVKVFKADIAEVGAFRPMLSQLEISQVPATAIVRPGRQAVLIQGFVDAGTLRQNVADALR